MWAAIKICPPAASATTRWRPPGAARPSVPEIAGIARNGALSDTRDVAAMRRIGRAFSDTTREPDGVSLNGAYGIFGTRLCVPVGCGRTNIDVDITGENPSPR